MVDGHAFEMGELVRLSRDKQAGLRWPIPVDARLDDLLNRAIDAGERTNRRELLAAIVANLDVDGEVLGQMLRTYRRMRVRDIVLSAPAGARIIRIADQRPGPRVVRGDDPQP